jgi:hypothetical protein
MYIQLNVSSDQLDKLIEIGEAARLVIVTSGLSGFDDVAAFIARPRILPAIDLERIEEAMAFVMRKETEMKLLPEETRLMAELQREFNERYEAVLTRAIEICRERAPLYDTTEPVWRRVDWPEGFLHEDRKKLGRIANIFEAGDLEEKWPDIREEAIDKINYMAFLVAFGDMLTDTQRAPVLYPGPADIKHCEAASAKQEPE